MPSNVEVEAGLTIARRRFRESLDRIRTLEAQRDELLAALERALPALWIVATSGNQDAVAIHEQARAAIRKAKGE